MNYWLLTTEFPPMHGGGISTYCRFTAEMFAESGHDVTVFVVNDRISTVQISNPSSRVRLIQFHSNYSKTSSFLGRTARASYSMARMVIETIDKESKPDIIESQDYLGLAYYVLQFKHCGYAELQNIPVLITIHSPAFIYLPANDVPVYKLPEFWTGEMEKQSIVAATALISPSKFMLKEVQAEVPNCPGIQMVIPNPFRTAKDSLTHPYHRNKIVYFGKLSPQKGSFKLLQYFRRLWEKDFAHPLFILGGSDIIYQPEERTMGDLIRNQYRAYIESGLLQMHGKIEPSKIAFYLTDAHIVLIPSIIDNQPYALMEAMAMGKIVLTSVQGGQAELIENGVNGFLFDHDIPHSFETVLLNILSLDDQNTLKIMDRARTTVLTKHASNHIFSKKFAFIRKLFEQSESFHFPFLHQEATLSLPVRWSIPDLLSIVIPYYNMGEYIDDCIESVLRSTYAKIEIIIVDDGSTDDRSKLKLEQFEKFADVKIIKQNNNGVAHARNFGSSIARGEYLAFIDPDDQVCTTYYEKAIRALKKENVFFVGCWVQYFQESRQVWPAFTPQPPYVLLHNTVNSSGLVYKSNALRYAGEQDSLTANGLEDYESIVHMLSLGFNGVVLPEILFKYRVRKNSMSRINTRNKLLLSNSYITKKHSRYIKTYSSELINVLNANGPGYLYENPTFERPYSDFLSGRNRVISKLRQLASLHPLIRTFFLFLLKIKNVARV